MNANDLAGRIDQTAKIDPIWLDGQERATIVAALRQYAALEWLWSVKPHGPYVQQLESEAGRFLASHPSLANAYGSTVTEAINNLRAKLEPPVPTKWTTTITVNTGDQSVSLPVLTDGNGEYWLTPEQCDELEALRANKPPHEHVWGLWLWNSICGVYERRCRTQCAEVQRANELVPA